MNLTQVLVKHPLPFELFSYQKEDAICLAEYSRALADLPVGGGKTVISTLVALMKEAPAVLILVPPILILQWERWLKSLNIGPVIAYEGSVAERKALNIRAARWLVMSYGIFRNDFERLEQTFKHIEIFTIVDEAQVIKSAGSKIHHAVRDFSMGKELLLMTGTPKSSPMDAYAYIKLKTPTIYRNQKQFEMLHVEERDFFGQVLKWRNLDLMTTNFRLNCVYRTKEEISALSPKGRYVPIHYRLSKPHMKLYQKLMDEQLMEMEDGSKIDATTANSLYHASQQIICNLAHFSGDPKARSLAYDLVDEICEEVDVGNQASSKLIIWAQYKMTNAALHKYLANYQAVAAYSGSDSKAAVERFLTDPACRILDANPGSAGAGLNPQGVCSNSLFIESPTRTIPFYQAAGRIDRLGQRYPPINRIGIAEGTIQVRLYRNLLDNDALVQQVANSKKDLRAAIHGD